MEIQSGKNNMVVSNEEKPIPLNVDHHFSSLNDLMRINILDDRLYSFDSQVFQLTPALQSQTADVLISLIEDFLNSLPSLKKAWNLFKPKNQLVARWDLIPKDVKQALKNGKAEFIQVKDHNNALYLQIRAVVDGLKVNGKEYAKNRKIKDLPIGMEYIPQDIAGALYCLSMQNQLSGIATSLNELSQACELNFDRIRQGQKDDRLAKVFSSRVNFIQALSMTNPELQRQLLIEAVQQSNLARAELAYQIRSGISELQNPKYARSKEMAQTVYDINTAIVAMNNAVQISLYSYQALGESNAQLASVKEHEVFVKQVLLQDIELDGAKYNAWDVIWSSGDGKTSPADFGELPHKLLQSCEIFLTDSTNGRNLISGDIKNEYE